MSKPFDATLKMLLEESPASWPALFELPSGPATVIDADTSTVSGGADKVLRICGPPDWILHVEFQSGPDRSLPRRMHLDNALLEDRHGLPVRSAVLLLAPKANLRGINGLYECRFGGETYRTFHYRVVRLWQVPVGRLLDGDSGLLPLAPLTDVRGDQIPGVIERMKARLSSGTAADAARMWTATYGLMGLRYSKALSSQLLEGVIAMEESVTYQAIIQKGRLQEARDFVLRLANHYLGDPPPEMLRALDSIKNRAQLEEVGVRMADLNSWEEVLQQLAPRSRRRHRTP